MLEIEVTRHANGNAESATVTLESLVCERGVYPKEISRHELDLSLNQAFATRGCKVIPDFFYNPHSESYPHDLSFIVVARNKETDQIVGGAIVETYEVQDNKGRSLKINYISKVWVLQEYERNGLMKHLLVETEKKLGKQHPYVLRTSDSKIDEKYARWSDMDEEVPRYWIRGKGFFTKRDKKPKFPNAKHWTKVIAQHLNDKPASVVYARDQRPKVTAPAQAFPYRTSAEPIYAT